jgi:NAD-dependent dihydropyrimidine dehydrogenase PreA subunit
MKMTYLKNGETLFLDQELCNGCRQCIEVCPHSVFAMSGGRAQVQLRSVCMECGACARNCPVGAITVKAGVGCAAAIIGGMLRGKVGTCGCGKATEADAACCRDKTVAKQGTDTGLVGSDCC